MPKQKDHIPVAKGNLIQPKGNPFLAKNNPSLAKGILIEPKDNPTPTMPKPKQPHVLLGQIRVTLP